MYSVGTFVERIFQIALEHGYKIETCRGKGIRQINFGHKKLHEEHIKLLYPDVLKPSANINELIERVAPGRPCSHRPFREIIKQIHRENPN